LVNLDKWEEIGYSDIRKGDRIRVVTQQGNVINDTKGIAHSYVKYHGWQSIDCVTFLSTPDRFKPIGGGYRTIYRRKAKEKPFIFPKETGAVISAKGKLTGHRFNFILSGNQGYVKEHDRDMFYRSSFYLEQYYEDFRLVQAGISA
jgi:hypothetical protein